MPSGGSSGGYGLEVSSEGLSLEEDLVRRGSGGLDDEAAAELPSDRGAPREKEGRKRPEMPLVPEEATVLPPVGSAAG